MEEIRFTIPINPTTKKNSSMIVTNKKTNRPFIMPSKQFSKYERECLKYLPKIDTIDYGVNIECHFYMLTRRKCDLTNLLEAIDDVLVKGGIISDDNCTIVVSHDKSRVHYDKNNPHVEVIITKEKDTFI